MFINVNITNSMNVKNNYMYYYYRIIINNTYIIINIDSHYY